MKMKEWGKRIMEEEHSGNFGEGREPRDRLEHWADSSAARQKYNVMSTSFESCWNWEK